MVGVGQVRHLVDQHRVEHPLRHRAQAVRDADLARVVRARRPTGRLVGHPAHRDRVPPEPVTVAQCDGSRQELVVTGRALQALAGEQPLHEPVDRLLAGLDVEVRGQGDDDASSDPLGLRGLAATCAEAYLDLGRGRTTVSRSGARLLEGFAFGRAARRSVPARTRTGRRRRRGSWTALWPIGVTVQRMPGRYRCSGRCRGLRSGRPRQPRWAEREGHHDGRAACLFRCRVGRGDRLHRGHRLRDRRVVAGLREGGSAGLGRHHPLLQLLRHLEDRGSAGVVADPLLHPAREHHRLDHRGDRSGQVVRQEHGLRGRPDLPGLHLHPDPRVRAGDLPRAGGRRSAGDVPSTYRRRRPSRAPAQPGGAGWRRRR